MKTRRKRSESTEMDRHHRELLRSLERNESFQDRLNLLPQQVAWEDAFQTVKHGLNARTEYDLPYSVLGFIQMDDVERGRFGAISTDRLIIRSEKCFVLMLNRIDSRHWKGHDQRRKFRLNFQMARMRLDGDGELWADNVNDEPAWQERLKQKDLAKPPMQDHPRFELLSYDPNNQFAALKDPVLKSPMSGKFSLSVNDRHVELLIGDVPVYRLAAAEAATLGTHADDPRLAQDGQHVKRGTPLVKLTTRCHYGQLRWEGRRERRPDIDRIGGDVISATREGNLLLIASEMMRRMGLAAQQDTFEDAEAIEVEALERWAPRHLLEFQAEVLDNLPMMDQWKETPALRKAIMEGLQPNGGFFARSDVPEPTLLVDYSQRDHYVKLTYENGHEQVLPKTAVILEHLLEGGSVSPDDPVAHWTEPRFFEDWDDVKSAVPQVNHVAREYLQQSAVRPGTAGFNGEGLLVDQLLLPLESAVRQDCIAHHVDLRAAAKYLDETGAIIGCPLKADDWTDWCRVSSGIGYNCEPFGERLSGNPVVLTDNRSRR